MFGKRRKKDPHAELTEAMEGLGRKFVDGADDGRLDYSPESLVAVDEYLDRMHQRRVTLSQEQWYGAAAYIFEVARRQYGGRYLRGHDEENPFVLVIGEPEFQIGFCAMGKVQGRVRNGMEDNIPFFYQGLERPVSQRSDATII